MIDFDASSVARDVGELYEPVAEERGIVLAISAEPGLYLHGSRELAGQAVANLVDNALKYGCPEAAGQGPIERPRKLPKAPSNSRRGGVAAMSNSSSRIAVRASPRTIACACSIDLSGSKTRARGLAPASAFRSPRRSRVSTMEPCGSRITSQAFVS